MFSRSGKAHLKFGKNDRKELRDKLLRNWKFAKHYVDSAINTVIGLVKGWIIVRFDLRELYHIHRVYEEKRKRIQKLVKIKPKTAKKLMQKYSKRERNRARDIMHKITTTIVRGLVSIKHGAILEDLRNIKDRILSGSKDLNRKLSKWNCRIFQSMLEYKLKWFCLPVKYVNPSNSSKTCPVCLGRLSAYRDRLLKCNCGLIQDRDVIAVLNLRMWGLGVAPNGDVPFGDVSQCGHKDYVR